MDRPATDGRHLADLVRLAIAPCRQAARDQQQLSRRGAGRPPEFEEWQIAVLIFVAVANRRKSKSAQWRFLSQHAAELTRLLSLPRMPARSTYMERYTRAHRLLAPAVMRQGRLALREHVGEARTVAADKSLIAARGPVWSKRRRKRGERPVGVDDQAAWGKSAHDGWVWGYSYEVVVCCATRAGRAVLPLLASADVASRREHRSFAEKSRCCRPACATR